MLIAATSNSRVSNPRYHSIIYENKQQYMDENIRHGTVLMLSSTCH